MTENALARDPVEEDSFAKALRVLAEANDAEGIRLLIEERKLHREALAENILPFRLDRRKKDAP